VKTINRILTTLLYVSPKRGLLYVTDAHLADKLSPLPTHIFEHLSCFLPGLLALGAHSLPDHVFDNIEARGTSPQDEQEVLYYHWKELHMIAAQGLAEACYQMYEDQPTRLGPEEVQFFGDGELWIRKMRKWRVGGKEGKPPGIAAKKRSEVKYDDYNIRKPGYLLRPEVRPDRSRIPFSRINDDFFSRLRLWSQSSCYGKLRETASGVNVAGLSSRHCRNTRRQGMAIHRS
jgi:hypothetical protein